MIVYNNNFWKFLPLLQLELTSCAFNRYTVPWAILYIAYIADMLMICCFCLLIIGGNILADPRKKNSKAYTFQIGSFTKTSLWIKVVSSWLCYFIYAWTLAAPAMFPDRDFGY